MSDDLYDFIIFKEPVQENIESFISYRHLCIQLISNSLQTKGNKTNQNCESWMASEKSRTICTSRFIHRVNKFICLLVNWTTELFTDEETSM